MNSSKIATKYLKLIVLLVLALLTYRIYQSDISLPFLNEKDAKEPTQSMSMSDLQKQKQTLNRIKSYEHYLSTTLKDLKALESTASINISGDLYLDKLYLDDLRSK